MSLSSSRPGFKPRFLQELSLPQKSGAKIGKLEIPAGAYYMIIKIDSAQKNENIRQMVELFDLLLYSQKEK